MTSSLGRKRAAPQRKRRRFICDLVRELIVDRDIEFEHDHPDEYDLDCDGEHGYVP